MGYSCLWPSPSVDQMKTFKVPKHLQVFSWGQHCIFLQSLLFAYTLTQISSISDPLLGESGFILSMNWKLSEQKKMEGNRWPCLTQKTSSAVFCGGSTGRGIDILRCSRSLWSHLLSKQKHQRIVTLGLQNVADLMTCCHRNLTTTCNTIRCIPNENEEGSISVHISDKWRTKDQLTHAVQWTCGGENMILNETRSAQQ